MTFDEYQEFCKTTAIYPERHQPIGLLYTVLGLANESGECAGKVKKLIRDEKGQLNEEYKTKILDEVSDVCWYVAMLCDELNTSLSSVIQHNVEKLTDRKERNVLSGSGDNR